MPKGKSDSNWKDKVLAWQASKKSVKTWCLENNIPITTFYGWRSQWEKSSKKGDVKHLKFPQASSTFIELKDKQPIDSGIVLEWDGLKIHLQTGFDTSILKQCLACLRGEPC